MKIDFSTKHIKIDKARSTILTSMAIASLITVFCLVSVKSLLAQASHQHRVLNANNAAVKQLKDNLAATNTLVTRFKIFNASNPNMIGGIADNNSPGPTDGDNARITLDALPSVYDFPALISSLDKILGSNAIGTPAISGTDQSASSSNIATDNPQPIAIPVTLSGTSSYANVQNLVHDLERSIRPFDVTAVQFSGNEAQMQLSLTVNTYYQQAKNFNVGSKEIK